MNNSLTKEKTVTTKELAKILGVEDRTIRNAVEKLGKDFRKSISKTSNGGRPTMMFTQQQATAIKIELQNHSKVAKNGFDTLTISNDLEMLVLQKRLSEYQSKRIAELEDENKMLSTQKEKLEIELDQSKEWYSIKRMQKLNPGYHFNYRLLKNESKRLDIEVGRTFDQNYGKVNTYHRKVWESLYFDTLNFD